MPRFFLNFKVNIIYPIYITWLQTFSTKLDDHLTVLFSCLGFVYIISSFLADQSGSLPDPGEAELLARAVLLTADLQQTRSEEPGLELLLQPLLDVLRRLSTNVYLVLHKTDKSLQLLLRLLQLHRRRSDTEKENGVCCVWENKTNMPCLNMPKPWIWCVCRGCLGCRVEDSHAVCGGISAGVSAEKVERGTEGGECFLCITYNNPARKN